MPYVVNGQVVTEDRIRAEVVRMQHDPRFTQIADEDLANLVLRTTSTPPFLASAG
jgi:preprotein translocase subunit SecF